MSKLVGAAPNITFLPPHFQPRSNNHLYAHKQQEQRQHDNDEDKASHLKEPAAASRG
jgi:hypothetical protein